MAYTLDELTQRALTFGILTPQQLQEVWSSFGSDQIDNELFLQTVVRRGFLTNYQVDRLTSDESNGFFFGDYKALYIVGAGTFARVFRTVHRDNAAVAAVKVLRARFSDNKVFIEHFLNEAKLGTQLKHPNIVPIHAASSDGYLHYMVMDFVEGQTLREFIKIRKKIDPKTASLIVRDIASGLEYALRKGLQHRDLKLSNVMLSSNGEAKLVDFGLASIAERADVSVPFLKNQQSVDYIALERGSGAKRNDQRSDLYFLGCIYYHLLSGVSPFPETKDRSKRLDRGRFFNVKPLHHIDSSIPFEVVRIVSKSMEVDPEARYSSPTAMLMDLNKICEKLQAEENNGTAAAPDGTAAHGSSLTLGAQDGGSTAEMKRSIMIVDANPEMRQVLREAFKKVGFRVMIIDRPEESLEKLAETEEIVQCLIFNATSLGLRAIKWFNEAGNRRLTKDIPAILLLDESQGNLVVGAHTCDWRPILQMPVSIKQLRETVLALIESKKNV